MRTYLRLLCTLSPYIRPLVLVFVLMVLFAIVDGLSLVVLIPFLRVLFSGDVTPASIGVQPEGLLGRAEYVVVHELFSWLTGPTPIHTLTNLCLLIFSVYFFKAVLGYFQQYLPQKILERALRDLRATVFAHLQNLSFRYYQRTHAGQLLSIMANDVQLLRNALATGLFKVTQRTLEMVVTVYIMLRISWQLTLVALIVLPPIAWIAVLIARKLRHINRERLQKLGDVTSALQENIAGIRIVKAFGAEPFERERFRRDNQEYTRNVVRSQKYAMMGSPTSEFLLASAVVLILYIGGRMILEQQALNPEMFIVFLLAALKLSSPLKYLSKLNEDVQPALAAGDRIFAILDTEPEVVESPDATPIQTLRERIEYRDVSFAYEDRDGPVIRNASFTISRGDVVALVGPSGGGKSTLVDLLPRFYDPTGGAILFDGIDLRDVKIADLRAQLGIVTQEVILFHDTIAANIAYGAEADHDQLQEAAGAANALEFIEALPDGFETVIGERGIRLSGGQRQRIAIARAIYKNPPILILDEATSALDTESERLVQQAIERLMKNRTSIVVAHRLSTIQRADKIVVIDRGRVVEQGTHAELHASDGRYRQLYELQFTAHPAAPVAQSAESTPRSSP